MKIRHPPDLQYRILPIQPQEISRFENIPEFQIAERTIPFLIFVLTQKTWSRGQATEILASIIHQVIITVTSFWDRYKIDIDW